ncbi:hypothetical protein, partial [Klebsiella pneumoniae]|uniref:hypothetical protein n=1 Tax=Klebsiella pneumoniae TaxID=573 RepID=UPI001C6F2221
RRPLYATHTRATPLLSGLVGSEMCIRDRAFCVSVVRPACRYVSPVALRLPGLQNRTPDKVRSTASGENYAMFAPLSPFNAK